jgi:hypothetical protein
MKIFIEIFYPVNVIVDDNIIQFNSYYDINIDVLEDLLNEEEMKSGSLMLQDEYGIIQGNEIITKTFLINESDIQEIDLGMMDSPNIETSIRIRCTNESGDIILIIDEFMKIESIKKYLVNKLNCENIELI